MKTISTIALCLVLSSLTACFSFNQVVDARNSPTQTITQFANQKITAIDVSHSFRVEVSQGAVSSATIEIPEVLIPFLEIELSADGDLEVGLNSNGDMSFQTTEGQLKLHVTTPELISIRLRGASSAVLATPLAVESLKIDLSEASSIEANDTLAIRGSLDIEASGASQIKLSSIEAHRIDIDITGASFVQAAGQTNEMNLEASGASEVKLDNCVANHVQFDLSGASSATINSRKSISGTASGVSKVVCLGEGGASMKVSTSGSSSVSRQ